MAHGSKRWIRDYKGRLKKSSDRTYKDWKGDLNAPENKKSRKHCKACEEIERPYKEYNDSIRAEYNRQHAALTEKYGVERWKHQNEMTVGFVHIPWSQRECDECKEKHRIQWNWHLPHENNGHRLRGISFKWAKTNEHQKYRRQVRHLMVHERYDDIVPYFFNWWNYD